MAFHNYPRFTKDIDFIVMSEQIEEIKSLLKKIGYFESAQPWTFKSIPLSLHRFMKIEGEDFLIVDVLTGTDKQYKEIIENSISAKWSEGSVKIAKKDDIIWLKQLRNSDQDKVDIKRLQNDKDRKSD